MPSPLKKSFAAEQLRQRKKSPVSKIIAVVAFILFIVTVGQILYISFREKEMPTETVAPPAEEIKSGIQNSLVNYQCEDDITFMIIKRIIDTNYSY